MSCFSGEFAELDAVPGEFMFEGGPGVGPDCWGFVTEEGALEYRVVEGAVPPGGWEYGGLKESNVLLLEGAVGALAGGTLGGGGGAAVVTRRRFAIAFSAS